MANRKQRSIQMTKAKRTKKPPPMKKPPPDRRKPTKVFTKRKSFS